MVALKTLGLFLAVFIGLAIVLALWLLGLYEMGEAIETACAGLPTALRWIIGGSAGLAYVAATAAAVLYLALEWDL